MDVHALALLLKGLHNLPWAEKQGKKKKNRKEHVMCFENVINALSTGARHSLGKIFSTVFNTVRQ